MTGQGVVDALAMKNGLLGVNGPLWSLSIEVWIYLVVGFSVFAFSASGMVWKLVGALGALFCVKTLFDVNAHSGFYLTIWMIGALVAVAARFRGWFQTRHWMTTIVLVILAGAGGVLFPNLILAGGRSYGVAENLMQILIVLALASVALPDLHLGASRTGQTLFRLGESSYTLYIIHFPIMLFLLSVYQALLPVSVAMSGFVAAASVVVCVVVADVSARLVENKKLFSILMENGVQSVKSAVLSFTTRS